MLKELLKRYISPQIIYARVRSSSSLRRRLSIRDMKAINSAENKGYIDFDLPLIYTIVRGFCPDIRPTRGWDHPNDPQSHEISLGDDMERCRRLFSYIIHRPNIIVSAQEFYDVMRDFKEIAQRFEIRLNTQPNELVAQFEDLRTSKF